MTGKVYGSSRRFVTRSGHVDCTGSFGGVNCIEEDGPCFARVHLVHQVFTNLRYICSADLSSGHSASSGLAAGWVNKRHGTVS